MTPHIDYVFKVGQITHRQTVAVGTPWREATDGFDKLEPIGAEWPAFAWPGGYPVAYYTQDNGCLCPKCATENLELTLGEDPQWKIVAAEINYEDPDLFCDHCNKRIPSAYAEG